MSKKSKKSTQAARSVAARPAQGSRPVRKSAAKAYQRPEPVVNRQALRILAYVIAAICLIGGIAIVLTAEQPYPVGTIIELVLLVIIAAASLFTALRTEVVTAFFAKLR